MLPRKRQTPPARPPKSPRASQQIRQLRQLRQIRLPVLPLNMPPFLEWTWRWELPGFLNGSEKSIGSTHGSTGEFFSISSLDIEYQIKVCRFVASLSNGLLWAQIVIGAALTALGASSAPGAKTAIIYLGASSTIIAGLLTYFKSRNQPNRVRQFRQALRGVRNKMDETAHEVILDKDTPDEGRKRAMEIIKMYNDALSEAAANYPDLWFSITDMKKYLPGFKDDSLFNRTPGGGRNSAGGAGSGTGKGSTGSQNPPGTGDPNTQKPTLETGTGQPPQGHQVNVLGEAGRTETEQPAEIVPQPNGSGQQGTDGADTSGVDKITPVSHSAPPAIQPNTLQQIPAAVQPAPAEQGSGLDSTTGVRN
jgi:SMODS and SLOG-associating 2TM effector domain